jgi:two-component system sensor histidine kinase/response regulator
MDFQMPVLDGISATKQIRGLGIKTPIIGLTANADEVAKLEATQAGMCNLIMKPVKGNDLKAIIEKSLEDIASGILNSPLLSRTDK